ncbi:MAG: hypothetical protein AAGG09_13555 [Pseudomonadota bacterium]
MEDAQITHFFRIRENGAAVFRIDDSARSRRLEMDQIAVVNVRNGEVKPQGARELTDADHAAIADWLTQRRAELARRAQDDAEACIERLNLTAHWAQAKASPEELEAVTERLILAMHDLRGVLVRKKAERLARSEAPKAD